MAVTANQLSDVAHVGRHCLHDLDDLDEQLSAVHEIVFYANMTVNAERADVLAELWTFLGGNKRRLWGFDENSVLLGNVGKYERTARERVLTTILAVSAMDAQVADMRESAVMPQIAGENVEVEVHVRSIRAGTEKLSHMRAQTIEQGETNRGF